MADLRKRFPLYSKLLRLYPPEYRKVYEDQMLQTLADMLDDAPSDSTRRLIWAHLMLDFPTTLLKQQICYTGGIMIHDMPRYIKRNALVGGILLLPFVLALVSNGLHELVSGQPLYHSWLWQVPALALWALYLPLLAALIGLTTWIRFLVQHAHRRPRSWIQAVLDIRYTWPIVLTTLGGLFILAVIFGHDSVHCVIGNPIHEVQHWHNTWQCVQQGSTSFPFQHPLQFLRRTLGFGQ